MTSVVLASASPRRRELLREAGIAFVAHPVDVDESARPHETPETMVARLARAKARAAVAQGAGPFVVAADTVAALGPRVLGKPRHRDDAVRMLRRLSGTRHRVLTGVALLDTLADALSSAARQTWIVTTEVTMRRLRDAEIRAYVASGESDGKAGAYAIQETGDQFVTRIRGPFDNVVGLPVDVVRTWLRHREMGR